MSNNIHKQTYKGYTLFVNDAHFGIEFNAKGITASSKYEVPLQERFSLEDHIAFLKLRIDLYTKDKVT